MGVKIHGQTNKKYRRKPASILFSATAGDNTLHLRSQASGFDCTIDWGDGSTSVCPTGGGNIIHNYAVAGDYVISIFGNSFAGIFVANQTGKEKYKEIYSMGKWKIDTFTTMSQSFYGCSNLLNIHENAFKYVANIISYYYTFRDCVLLSSVPIDIFRYNPKVTSFTSVFCGCTNLTNLPQDIFRFNTLATSFQQVFYNCTSITTLPSDLFRYNTEVTNMADALCNTRITSVQQDIFRYNTKVTNFSEVLCLTSLAEIPIDLFRYNTEATQLDKAFSGTAITTVPQDIFRYNTKALNFRGVFNGCTKLATLPADLFTYNALANSFDICFYGSPKLQLRDDIFGSDYANRFNGKTVLFTNTFKQTTFTGVQGTAPRLWNFAGLTATKTGCFGGSGNNATSLSNYAEIPAEWIA